MPRPLFRASAAELEKLFKQHKDDDSQLAMLLAELEHRSSARTITLKGRILRLLAVRKAGYAADGVATAGRSRNNAQPRLPLNGPAMQSAARSGPEPRPNDPARIRDQNTGPAPKLETSRIRKQGRLRDVPDARPRLTSNQLDLKLSPDAPLLQRYTRSLDALVNDMRWKNSGMRMLAVTDGRRVNIDIHGYGYQFTVDGDESLFEGAAIVAQIAGQAFEGQIASMGENRVTLSLRQDLGPEIDFCLLRIDNTAMIEALRKRLEEISKSEVTNFNSHLASVAITQSMPDRHLA